MVDRLRGPRRSSCSRSKGRCSSSRPKHRDWSRCSRRQNRRGYDVVSFYERLAPCSYILYYYSRGYFWGSRAKLARERTYIVGSATKSPRTVALRRVGRAILRRADVINARVDFRFRNGGEHPPFPCYRHIANVSSGIVSVGSSEARAAPQSEFADEGAEYESKTETPRLEPKSAAPEQAGMYSLVPVSS